MLADEAPPSNHKSDILPTTRVRKSLSNSRQITHQHMLVGACMAYQSSDLV